jgi:hypothetical protein
MLAACARKNSRQLGPLRRGAGPSFAWARSRRMLVGDTPGSRASPARRRSADGPSADSPARTGIPPPEPQPTGSAVRAGRAPVATSDERAFDASAEASAESLDACHAMSAGGGTLLPPAAPDQPSGASVVRPAGAGSRARGATPAARRLSHADPDGYAQARRAEPALRDRGRKRPCRRSSQPLRQEERHQYWRPSACSGDPSPPSP